MPSEGSPPPITACPRCGASTELEANSMCKPGVDDCPMLLEEDWDDAMRALNVAAAEPLPPEYDQQEGDQL